MLQKFFCDDTLSDIPENINVMVTTCILKDNENYEPKLFLKYQGKCTFASISNRFQIIKNTVQYIPQYKLYNIARATSAVYPILPKFIDEGHEYVDGGFFYNNVDKLVKDFLKKQS